MADERHDDNERLVPDELVSTGIDLDGVPDELPVLAVRGTVLFPGTIEPLLVDDGLTAAKIGAAVGEDRLVVVVATWPGEAQAEPSPYAIGTLGKVAKILRLPTGKLNVIVQGLARAEIVGDAVGEPLFRAAAGLVETTEPPAGDVEADALMVSARRLLDRFSELTGSLPPALTAHAGAAAGPGALADIVAAHLDLRVPESQELLELTDSRQRLQRVVESLSRELQIFELSQKIESEVQEEIDKSQRDFYLRERLKAIRRELGEDEEGGAEGAELAERIDEAGMPEDVEKVARKELERLGRTPQAAAEYNVLRTYIDWLLDMPWDRTTEDNLDLGHAERVLDEDHYDLDKVKKRILEYLAVRKLKPDVKGPILCFVGPPGVGKTSLGRSIARALDREFVRLSLGGIHDEAEIRGHRRTYVGALPGRIIQGIKKAGSMNPVFMLDEIDKIGTDFRGDPSSALLEVLDPEQNHAFSDHFLEVPFDLSRVLFIATGNVPEQIPDALHDRMEILELPGYTAEEKVFIAQQYLIPRQREEHGLEETGLTFTDDALATIVQDYTEEAGVRELERQIAAICRSVARTVAVAIDESPGDRPDPVEVGPEALHDYLGAVKYFSEVAEHTAEPGVAIGLAWTASGGDILFVEATRMKGKGELTLTGQLGEVMKESAQAAMAYLRSRAEPLGIPSSDFDGYDVHVHVPAGAVRKDGPSAGAAILIALASLFTERPVHTDLGMTGEITLRGKLLPVGGIKNKVLAARRAGLKRVLLPARNEKDLEEIPEPALSDLEFVFAHRTAEVLEAALQDRPAPPRPKGRVREAGGATDDRPPARAGGAARRGRSGPPRR